MLGGPAAGAVDVGGVNGYKAFVGGEPGIGKQLGGGQAFGFGDENSGLFALPGDAERLKEVGFLLGGVGLGRLAVEVVERALVPGRRL